MEIVKNIYISHVCVAFISLLKLLKFVFYNFYSGKLEEVMLRCSI